MSEVFNYINITAANPTTTTVKVGQGILHTVSVNTPVAVGVVKIYDAIVGAEDIEGTLIGTILTPAVYLSYTLIYDVAFEKGLVIKTSGVAQDITVTYR